MVSAYILSQSIYFGKIYETINKMSAGKYEAMGKLQKIGSGIMKLLIKLNIFSDQTE